MIKIYVGNRGFIRGDFKDAYGEACSIQESSVADGPGLWLGCDRGNHKVHGQCLARMHLTREMVAELIPLLEHFRNFGALPDPAGPYFEGGRDRHRTDS